jgi:hypothetical protein
MAFIGPGSEWLWTAISGIARSAESRLTLKARVRTFPRPGDIAARQANREVITGRTSDHVDVRATRLSRLALIPLLLAAQIASGCTAQATSTPGESVPRPGSIVDGFPLGAVLSPAPDPATAALGVRALDQRVPGHAGVLSGTAYHEDLQLIFGSSVARSGTMTVYVFALADRTYRAAGVYCGVGGCQPWPVYRPN